MMVKNNLTADLSTLNSLLEAYAEKGDAEMCLSLIDTIEDADIARADAR